ncbi:phytanoyl-CoA dioxygenase family protein [Sphingomonas sp. R647]|uniref:phytanoyl-CoA dioxygenase family protein n=1 Tax=Sphingomonas sp. R647 TaxID=2875233 RepID=UPI001CD3D499|nr:phytanoyl-CoA dioxygenase family protein [Sphingomonas sp. R647]MCA1198737.1 phytanoyl-CoA dioxygenase family protein [Sphingomonas sp. R647]
MLGALETSGAMRLNSAATDQLAEIRAALADTPSDRAGIRLARAAELEQMLGPSGAIGAQIALFAGTGASPVRAILFDKSDRVNWSLAWHQDRTIRVRARREVPGFGPWTVKAGLLHVAPPFEILERMVTIRIHLDDVPLDNAPLLIAPGSHRFGRVREDRIAAVVGECGVYACTARAGDIWVYATPIVHASDAAATPRRRRVLQVDYAGFNLPGGLEWSGI